MTDTNSTTTAPLNAGFNADATSASIPSEASGSTSGAPAQPSKTENAGSKADAGLSNSGDTPAAPTVSQDTFDRLHHDYQVVLAAFKAVKAELEETKAQAEQLAQKAKPAAAALYAHPDGEVGALKQRLHDLLAEAKAVADRLADIVPPKHPALSVSVMVHSLGREVRKLI